VQVVRMDIVGASNTKQRPSVFAKVSRLNMACRALVPRG
jgi:hypothetical protein